MKKNILITWTSKWLGYFLAEKLKDDFNIFGISRKKTDLELYREFNIDLTKVELINNFIKNCEQNNIKFDSVILNAWVWVFWKFQDFEEKEYINIINTNLTSNIILVNKLIPYLNKNAKIIFIWSIIWKKFMKYWAVYQASKFGLRWFAWWLKNELKNIKVHIINPKILKTSFHDKSKINIEFKEERITSLDSIKQTIDDLLSGKENRFEIDL